MGAAGVIFDMPRCLGQRGTGKLRAQSARRHIGHANAQMCHLLRQRPPHAFESKFAGAIQARARPCRMPADRGDVDNMPRAPRAHRGQHRADSRQRCQHIDREQILRIIPTGFLNRAGQAIARIIDQNIDPPGLCHRAGDGRLVRQIHHQPMRARRSQRAKGPR